MNTIRIGLSCTPSEILDYKTVKCQRMIISYGGGIGGSKKEYFAKKVTRNKTTNMLSIEFVQGGKIQVNPSFLVEQEECEVFILTTDITKHVNYHSRQCNKSILTEYFKISFGNKVEIVNQYTPRHSSPLNGLSICQNSEQS